MRKLLLLLAAMLTMGIGYANEKFTSYEDLIYAVAKIESGHNEKAVSKNGKWVGYLQISKGMVDECNKILKEKRFNYNDRLNKDKSIEMFIIFQEQHNPEHNIVKALRMWNEGVSVKYRKTLTHTPYTRKVLKVYNNTKPS